MRRTRELRLISFRGYWRERERRNGWAPTRATVLHPKTVSPRKVRRMRVKTSA
jgi:hypothetical protein